MTKKLIFSKEEIEMNKNDTISIVMLVGKEAYLIPSLAAVGAASIVGVAGYGAYKLGKKAYDKLVEKEIIIVKVKEEA